MNARLFQYARAVSVEIICDGAICIIAYTAIVGFQDISPKASVSFASLILAGAAHFALVTLAVRAVMHTPWHFWLRYRAARAHGFSWRRTYGWLAGTYALAYLVGIGATGGVLWESLIEQPVRIVLPSLAACLAAPYLTYKLLGETIDTLAAQGRSSDDAKR